MFCFFYNQNATNTVKCDFIWDIIFIFPIQQKKKILVEFKHFCFILDNEQDSVVVIA